MCKADGHLFLDALTTDMNETTMHKLLFIDSVLIRWAWQFVMLSVEYNKYHIDILPDVFKWILF